MILIYIIDIKVNNSKSTDLMIIQKTIIILFVSSMGIKHTFLNIEDIINIL
jgi:hypothetical protein